MDIQTIKKRRDFLKGNNAPYAAMPSVVVQSYVRTDEVVETDESVMMGITCSKKVGNAVKRNRAKRRLREAGKIVLKKIGVKKLLTISTSIESFSRVKDIVNKDEIIFGTIGIHPHEADKNNVNSEFFTKNLNENNC